MVSGGLGWSRVVWGDLQSFRVAEIGFGWFRIVQGVLTCLGWFRMVQDGLGWFRMV